MDSSLWKTKRCLLSPEKRRPLIESRSHQTLNKNSARSPSSTIYSFPSLRSQPLLRASDSEPAYSSFSQPMVCAWDKFLSNAKDTRSQSRRINTTPSTKQIPKGQRTPLDQIKKINKIARIELCTKALKPMHCMFTDSNHAIEAMARTSSSDSPEPKTLASCAPLWKILIWFPSSENPKVPEELEA